MRISKCKAKVVFNRQTNKVFITQPVHNHLPDYAQFMEYDETFTEDSNEAVIGIPTDIKSGQI